MFRSAIPALLLAAASPAQAGAFRPVHAAWPAPVLAVDEPSGGRLEARGTDVVRRRGAAASVLRCTLPGGPGEILALAATRSGATFLAGARGLFVTGPEVDAIDPLDLRDGVPSGTPVGIVAEGGRLWVATDAAFGCIDTRFFYGRTFTAEDGLPPGPYTGLALGDDGELLLRSAAGMHAFRPGRGAPPTLTVVRVAGQEHAPDRVHELSGRSGPIRLELAASGDGALTCRWRRTDHHLWQPLDAAHPELPAPDPGPAAFEIVALDRELRPSAPAILRVRAPYPPRFSKTFLLAAAAGGAAALLLLFLRSARGKGRAALLQAALSAAVALLVGLQALAGIVGHGRSWPFVGFSMYTERYHEGSLLYQPELVGTRSDGSRLALDPSSAGTAKDGLWQLLVPLVHGGPPARERWLQAYNGAHPDAPLRGLCVQERRWRLTADGPVRVAPIVLAADEAERR